MGANKLETALFAPVYYSGRGRHYVSNDVVDEFWTTKPLVALRIETGGALDKGCVIPADGS